MLFCDRNLPTIASRKGAWAISRNLAQKREQDGYTHQGSDDADRDLFGPTGKTADQIAKRDDDRAENDGERQEQREMPSGEKPRQMCASSS